MTLRTLTLAVISTWYVEPLYAMKGLSGALQLTNQLPAFAACPLCREATSLMHETQSVGR